MKQPKIAFFGSPEFALPVLEALRQHAEIVLVVTQPDKPVGRGNTMTAPPVARRAVELGLPLAQPPRLKGNTGFEQALRASGAELAITSAYGKILPASVLEIPRFGFINTHASLLPRYRGAAPIQWALINGETQTGITLMQTDIGMDTGDILFQETLEIPSDWTSIDVFGALSQMAARTLVELLENLGNWHPTPQDPTQATLAPMLTKEDGEIRWHASNTDIYNRYRGTFGWPGSFSFWLGKRLKVTQMALSQGSGSEMPGTIVSVSDTVRVSTGQGFIDLIEVQPENKAKMPARDWFKNFQVRLGQRFEGSSNSL